MFNSTYWITMLLSLPGILLAITFHEMAHGYAADAMGDPTPKLSGRLSPNPLRHLDPIGFICMLIFHFGWAKPVPVNPNFFKNRRKGIILVSLSGCLTNLLLAFVTILVIDLLIHFAPAFISNMYLEIILYNIVWYNIIFAVFNIIPVPPLDGSQVLAEFLPLKARQKFINFSRWSMLILLILMWTGIFGRIIMPIASGIEWLFVSLLDFFLGFIGL